MPSTSPSAPTAPRLPTLALAFALATASACPAPAADADPVATPAAPSTDPDTTDAPDFADAPDATIGFGLVRHDIDRSLREGDGLAVADLDGDGLLNPVIATGDGGQVYWFERADDGSWIRHLIAEGYTEIEGTIAADFNGDGRIEVVFFDQATRRPPGLVVLARQQTEDPRDPWSTVVLDDQANHVQQGLVHDITGDGRPDFYYAYEGRGADDGAFCWMQNLGGDPLDPDNWVKHVIDRIDGAWWIDGSGPRDFDDDGLDGDILVSVRESRNRAHSSGAILIYHQPADPLQGGWRKTVVTDLRGHDPNQVVSGDFTGNGDPRDIAYGVMRRHDRDRESQVGLHLYHRGERFGQWQRHQLSGDSTVSVRGHDFTGDGTDELIAMAFNRRQVQLWARDPDTGLHTLRAEHPFVKGDDLIVPADITGDGLIREFYLGSDPRGLFWFQVEVPD